MLSAYNVLTATFGYDQFRGQQQDIIDTVIAGDDALVVMPTGGGKSLCYQIPSIARVGCGIVISPLIALMEDQVNALKELGVHASYLNSTQTLEEINSIEQALIAGELDVLYVAPERLNQARTISLLSRVNIALFAIDEAHCVSQWGHDFRSDYLQLHQLAENFPNVPRIALTATADARTQQEIIERLQLKQAKTFIAGFDRPNIFYQITLKQSPKQQLLEFLTKNHTNDAGIVYCLSRKKTEDIALWLSANNFTALPYHAGMPHQQRTLHQQRFLREEKVIIVATIAFGMGIDKPDVRFVAHLDLPKSIEAYYQETGRAGRDGSPANAWMVYGLEDVIKLRGMMANGDASTTVNAEYKRIEYQKLESMLGLCEITTCRRHALLNYFGDDADESCGYCDMCQSPAVTWDGTEAAQKAISCAYRTKQSFGVSHLIDVLRGANTEKVKQFGHEQLSVYGIGKELNKKQWQSVYRQLIARNLLKIDFNNFNRVCLSERCRSLLRGETSIELRKDSSVSVALRKKSSVSFAQKHEELWETLRTCRMNIAKHKGVAPYIVFHDSVLVEMMEKLPTTTEQFGQIGGVGKSKQEQYADDFIAIIKQYIIEKDRDASSISATVTDTHQLLQSGASIDDIAAQRQLSLSTIYTHCSQLIRAEKIALADVVCLDLDDIKSIENVLIDLDMMNDQVKFKAAYDALSEAYDYPTLRCVHAELMRKLCGSV